MKTTLAISTILLSQMTYFSNPSIASEGQFATLKPEKSCSIVVPEGKHHSPVYFSKDCQTAYILPSLKMKQIVSSPYLTADKGICQRYQNTIDSVFVLDKSISYYKKLIKKLRTNLADETDENKIISLKNKLEVLTKAYNEEINEKNDAFSIYEDTKALRAKITVESDVMDEVAAFQLANLNQLDLKNNTTFPTRFVPASINESFLAISLKDEKANANSPKGRSVLNINFPGLQSTLTSDNSKLIMMNGSMSGIIDLSATSLCGAITTPDKIIENNEEHLKKIINNSIALNLDYKVKVQAGIKVNMKSSIQTKEFLNNFSNQIMNSAYTRTELLSQLIEGNVLNKLEIYTDDKGEAVDNMLFMIEKHDSEEKIDAISPIIMSFIKSYFDDIEEKLDSLGLTKKIDEKKALELKSIQTNEISGYTDICSKTSSFFGLKKSYKCTSTPVYVQVNHDALSKIIRENTDNSSITKEVVIEKNQTIQINHSSTFQLN